MFALEEDSLRVEVSSNNQIDSVISTIFVINSTPSKVLSVRQ